MVGLCDWTWQDKNAGLNSIHMLQYQSSHHYPHNNGNSDFCQNRTDSSLQNVANIKQWLFLQIIDPAQSQ